MKNKVKSMLLNKNLTMPILSFPSTQLLNCTVKELLNSSKTQAEGMKKIAERCEVSASLNMMDLSVEAECFGSQIKYADNEIPTVTKGAIDSIEDVDGLIEPKVGDGRTSIYINGVAIAKSMIKDKAIMCGVIGPYSLAGRIFDMTELMMECYDSPELVEKLVSKCSDFIIEYIKAYKAVGADGVIMAEPAAGLLSPDLCERFSSSYVKKIFQAVNDEKFIIAYHNCGNTIPLLDSIAKVGADIYHFGNAVDMEEVLQKFSKDVVVMGNINPVLFKTATPKIIREEVLQILSKCNKYDNFIISSGCDIPSDSKWENIDAYFKTVNEFYKERK